MLLDSVELWIRIPHKILETLAHRLISRCTPTHFFTCPGYFPPHRSGTHRFLFQDAWCQGQGYDQFELSSSATKLQQKCCFALTVTDERSVKVCTEC